MKEFKAITNFEKTKETLGNMELELPDVLELKNIRKVMINRDEKIVEEIIKPKDEVIQSLYNDNLALHRELSRQAVIIEEAEKYQKERDSIIADNEQLNEKVKNLEQEYKKKNATLDLKFNSRKRELEEEFKNKEFDIRYKYKNIIHKLEKENKHLNKIIDRFYITVEKFINWICHKFGIAESDELIRDFQKENNILLDPEKQVKKEEREKL